MGNLPEESIYVPYHKGQWRGVAITCLHTGNTFMIMYNDHWVFSKKCRIPRIELIKRDYFGPLGD